MPSSRYKAGIGRLIGRGPPGRPPRMGRRCAVTRHTGSSGSWLFWSPEHDLYLAGTVDQTTAAAVPYRLLPKVVQQVAG